MGGCVFMENTTQIPHKYSFNTQDLSQMHDYEDDVISIGMNTTT